MCNHDLHLEAGLVRTDDDFEGNSQYIGTDKQWDKFNELEQERDLIGYPQITPEEEALNQETVEK
jgi:hypothetical protein